MDGPALYEIQIAEQIDDRMSKWFGDLELVSGELIGTIMRGEMADQAALFGVLGRIRDLGLVLVSVQRSRDDLLPPGLLAGRPGGDAATSIGNSSEGR